MAVRVLRGVAASPGVAAGAARVLGPPVDNGGAPVPLDRRAGELQRAESALNAAATQLEALAARLRAEGREADAEIVETGVLMAADPG
ncbi:MAG TPA: phosphoenolpyruvate-utilizing N-terminal domain-containing protein, partial [Thermoleophilaceae bacterium]